MGGLWLRDLPTALAGLPNVDLYDGWQNRARSSGGYDALMGIACHHTASNTSPASDMAYMWRNASDGPVGAIYLARDGRITVGAAGATNCVGKGGPRATSRGTIPADRGNQNSISIEAANAGTGEAWPQVQQDRYVALVAALISHYQLAPGDVFSHYEWTPGRKIDPAGPSRFGTINPSGTWDMGRFRAELTSAPTPAPPPAPPSWKDDDIMLRAGKTTEKGTWVLGDGTTAITMDQLDSIERDLRVAGGVIDAYTKKIVYRWEDVSKFDEARVRKYVGNY